MPKARDAVRVRLTHKLADLLNGVDLTRVRQGEEMILSRREAFLLVAEGWAEPLDFPKAVSSNGNGNGPAVAADTAPNQRPRRARRKAIRR